MNNFRVNYVTRPQNQQDGAATPSTSNAQQARSVQNTSQSIVLPGNRSQPIVLQNGKPILLGERVLMPAGLALVPTNIQSAWQGGQVAKVIQGSFPPQMVLSTGQMAQMNVPFNQGASSTTWVMQQPQSGPSAPPVLAPPQRPSANQMQSSTTPDSGIQSVPTSPPSPNMVFTPSQIEYDADDKDFADMPRLLPHGQEDESLPSTSSPTLTPVTEEPTTSTTLLPAAPVAIREDGQSHASECETSAAPSFSISTTMDSDEIANKILELNPAMASQIANLLKKKTQRKRKTSTEKPREKSPQAILKRPRSSRATRKEMEEKKRHEEAEPVGHPTTAMIVDENLTQESSPPHPIEDSKGKKRKPPKLAESTKKAKVEEEKPETKVEEEEEDVMVKYRLAVDKQLKEATQKELETCTSELCQLRISAETNGIMSQKDIFTTSMAMTKAKGRPRKSTMTKKEAKTEKARVSLRTNRQSGSSPPEEEAVLAKFNGEYEEIPRSIAWNGDNRIQKWWEAPSLQCGCTRGACTSDAECINRALRIQCSQACSTLCANKKFWKQDTSRLAVSVGPRSKRHLRTKNSRRAGDFLCEYAGEVIGLDEAHRRWTTSTDKTNRGRCLCISPRLFIDASTKGNVARHIRHSCEPNSRLEVWSVNGRYRAGIFSLYDMASNTEITIDKSGLLPESIPCTCIAQKCKKVVTSAKNAIRANGADLTAPEESKVRQSRRMLVRNRRHVIQTARQATGLPVTWTASTSASTSASPMRRLLDGVLYRVRKLDGSMPNKVVSAYQAAERTLKQFEGAAKIHEKFEEAMKTWLEVIDDDDIDRAYLALRTKLVNEEEPEKRKKKSSVQVSAPSTTLIPAPAKLVNRQTDLSYLESKWPIGSYDPDEAWPRGKASAGDNAVRCTCGSLEEDGEMLQCDSCHFWLHIDCLGAIDLEKDYTCQFCTNHIPDGVPSTDVLLGSQPDVRFQSCSYYRALVNRRSIQVRLNETVFVLKAIGDDHKQILRQLVELSDKKKAPKKEKQSVDFPTAKTAPLEKMKVERKDSRIFRVERLFTAPGGSKFVFGFYYARPHETFCDSQRIFNTNEVFATPFYDTLPLDAVIGRCAVLDADIWCKGRPKVPLFKEEDVYVCEHQIDRNQRSFEKIPQKNRYFMNTQPYVFEEFEKELELKRDFTPFILSDRSGCSTPAGKSSVRKSQMSPSDEDTRKKLQLKKNASRNLNAIVKKLNAAKSTTKR